IRRTSSIRTTVNGSLTVGSRRSQKNEEPERDAGERAVRRGGRGTARPLRFARIGRGPAIGRDRNRVCRDDGRAVERGAERRAASAEARRRIPGVEPYARSTTDELGLRVDGNTVDEEIGAK